LFRDGPKHAIYMLVFLKARSFRSLTSEGFEHVVEGKIVQAVVIIFPFALVEVDVQGELVFVVIGRIFVIGGEGNRLESCNSNCNLVE